MNIAKTGPGRAASCWKGAAFGLLLFFLLCIGTGTGWTQDALPAAMPESLPGLDGPLDTGVVPQIRVQVKARRSANLPSRMSGVIEEITVKDGERFEEGQALVRFDCTLPRGELARAKAAAAKAYKVYETTSSLHKLKSKSTLELAVARAESAEASAEVDLYTALVERCEAKAPYAGIAGEVFAREHQYAREGEPLLEVLDDSALELECLVPSQWVSWLGPGYAFEARIDETGQTYRAEVLRLGGRVDPVSQSITLYAAIVDPAQGLMPGMSGVAAIRPPQ